MTILISAVLALLTFGAWADEPADNLNYWTGAVDHSWRQNGNWSKGTVPSSTEIAVFELDGDLTVTNGSPAVCGIRLTGGNLALNVSSVTVYGSGGVTGVVDVATGLKLSVGATFNAGESGGAVEKIGGGTILVNSRVGNSRSLDLVISDGLWLAGGSGGASGFFNPAKLTIRTGGVLSPYTTADGADKDKHGAFNDLQSMTVEADGIFDCRGKSVSLPYGLAGSGLIRNAAGTFCCATNFTGSIVSSGASLTFGTGDPIKDFVFAGVKEITLPTASTPSLYLENAEPQRVTTPIRGGARLWVYNSCVDLANVDLRASQCDIYHSFVVSGGRITSSGTLYFKNAGLTLTVTNGASVCGDYAGVSTRNPGSALNQPNGLSLNGSSITLRAESGGELTFYDSWAGHMEAVNGGTLRFGRYQKSSATVLLDGGRYVMQADFYGYNGFQEGSTGTLLVGAGGGRFEQESTVQNNNGYLDCAVGPADGVTADGGLSFSGNISYYHYRPFGLTGPISLLGGSMNVQNTTANKAMKSSLLGTGDLRLGNTTLSVASAVTPAAFAQGAGKTVTLVGSSRLMLPVGATQSLTFGDPAATATTLTREKGGLLTLNHEGNEMLYGETTQVKVSGGVPVDPQTGLTRVPVFTQSAMDVAAKKSDVWARRFYFTTYDATKGFVAVTNMASGLADDATKVRRITSATLAADTTNRVAGLCIIGSSSSASDPTKSGTSLKLSAGSVLKVGNGVDPAGVLMNSDGSETVAAIKGEGTLDFGTSEGVVLVNRRPNSVCLLTKIVGSNGVTFATPADGSGSIYLGANEYSGGTWISGTTVKPRTSTSFGTGAVRTGLGNGASGAISVDVAGLDFTNRLYLAGYGIGRSANGALRFGASATWSGDIELVEPARINVYGPETEATISGTISGDRLQLFLSNASTDDQGVFQHGTLRLTAANSHTGGTHIVRSRLALSGNGTLGTGRVLLDRGILRIENGRTEKSIPNEIAGVGTVELTGRGLVNFSGGIDANAREGANMTLDVQSRCAKVNTLAGFASVTAPTGMNVTLNVLDTTPFTGEVAANVTIVYGPQPKLGLAVVIR